MGLPFSTARDIASLGQALLDRKKGNRSGLPLRMETISEMTRLQTAQPGSRRGLAFVLWQPDPESEIARSVVVATSQH